VLGDWEMAASVNERAAAVDREYFARTNAHSGYGGYFVHNLQFIAYARWMQGRKADGLRAAEDMAAAISPMAKAMPEMADAFLSLAVLGRVRFSDWDGILKLPQPEAGMSASIIMWDYARALAFAGKGDAVSASREQAAFEAMRAQTPKDAAWGNNKAVDVLALASEIVAARLEHEPGAAVPHWERAVALQDALSYDEPPSWYYPVRESLGAALLRAGRAAEAEAVLHQGVRRSPRNGRMLFALMEALRSQNKSEEAAWVKREFDAAWSKADVRLQLAEL
jgi:tetratricopeptide (TPR) repeat protein